MARRRRSNKKTRANPNMPRKTVKKYRRFERLMSRFIQQMFKDLQTGLDRVLVPRIDLLAGNFKQEPKTVHIIANPITKEPEVITDDDANSPVGMELSKAIDLVEAQFLGLYSPAFIASNLRDFFKALDVQVDVDSVREFTRQNIKVFPVGTDDIINNSVETSLGKIKDLQASTIGLIRAEVTSGLVRGQRWETIAKRITRSMTAKPAKGETPTPLAKASNRAKFIARNEVGTALGTINKERQLAANVRLYTWQTTEDERVRGRGNRRFKEGQGDHRKLNGNIYSWEGTVVVDGTTYEMADDNVFKDTMPGEPYNCRCVAIPYIPEFEEENDDDN